MVSDIYFLIALPVLFWTVLLDKGHCGQYNSIYLNTSLALYQGVSRQEKAVMQITFPLRIRAESPALVFYVPAGTDLLTVPRPAPPLANPTSAIAHALLAPRGT